VYLGKLLLAREREYTIARRTRWLCCVFQERERKYMYMY